MLCRRARALSARRARSSYSRGQCARRDARARKRFSPRSISTSRCRRVASRRSSRHSRSAQRDASAGRGRRTCAHRVTIGKRHRSLEAARYVVLDRMDAPQAEIATCGSRGPATVADTAETSRVLDEPSSTCSSTPAGSRLRAFAPEPRESSGRASCSRSSSRSSRSRSRTCFASPSAEHRRAHTALGSARSSHSA